MSRPRCILTATHRRISNTYYETFLALRQLHTERCCCEHPELPSAHTETHLPCSFPGRSEATENCEPHVCEARVPCRWAGPAGRRLLGPGSCSRSRSHAGQVTRCLALPGKTEPGPACAIPDVRMPAGPQTWIRHLDHPTGHRQHQAPGPPAGDLRPQVPSPSWPGFLLSSCHRPPALPSGSVPCSRKPCLCPTRPSSQPTLTLSVLPDWRGR